MTVSSHPSKYLYVYISTKKRIHFFFVDLKKPCYFESID